MPDIKELINSHQTCTFSNTLSKARCLLEYIKRSPNIDDEDYDCFEIANDLQSAAASNGVQGAIYTFSIIGETANRCIMSPRLLLFTEYDHQKKYAYHTVFVLDGFIIDPRISRNAKLVSLDEFLCQLMHNNPGEIIKYYVES